MTPKEKLIEKVHAFTSGRNNVFALVVCEDDEGVNVRGLFEADPREYLEDVDNMPESYKIGMSICSGIMSSINANRGEDDDEDDDEPHDDVYLGGETKH